MLPTPDDLPTQNNRRVFWRADDSLVHLSVYCNWRFVDLNKAFREVVGGWCSNLISRRFIRRVLVPNAEMKIEFHFNDQISGPMGETRKLETRTSGCCPKTSKSSSFCQLRLSKISSRVSAKRDKKNQLQRTLQ